MKTWDIVILIEGVYLGKNPGDQYFQNVLDEQTLVQNALEALNLKVLKVAWDNPTFDWSSTKAVLIREIWDYYHRFPEFSKWLDATIKKTNLINPAALIRWNLDKHYLLDLQDGGINVCSSRFIEAGEKITLAELQEQEELEDFVLKPAISGAARHTYRLNANTIAAHEEIFQELIANESMMIQPFQKNILTRGEVAYMVYGGKYSHAILKIAQEGDFRVQDDFGGSVALYEPNDEEIAFAEHVVSKTNPQPVYARVDVIWDNNEELAVAELELIEPELWFRFKPEAAALLAEEVKNCLHAE